MRNITTILILTMLGLFGCEKKRVTHKPFSPKSPAGENADAPSGQTHLPEETPKVAESIPKAEEKEAPVAYDERGPGSAEFHLAARASMEGETVDFFDLYLTSCQKGFLPGCHRYGWIQEKKGNIANANNFYTLSCNGKYWKSCNNLAFYYEKVNDAEKAKEYYSLACEGQHPGACENLQRLSQAH
ncbi:MAG: hypothetical protein AB7T49_18765 [Oligoflexales bacterium]